MSLDVGPIAGLGDEDHHFTHGRRHRTLAIMHGTKREGGSVNRTCLLGASASLAMAAPRRPLGGCQRSHLRIRAESRWSANGIIDALLRRIPLPWLVAGRTACADGCPRPH